MLVAMEWLFVTVVGVRLLLPLLIPLYPLPAIVACLVVDAVDQTVFQAFGYDPPGYQSYDKAMDVYYLAIAYLATLRNWDNLHAFAIARFLFYYRLIGAFLFEMTHERWLLLVFPNTFEYFFIAYEGIRSRWSPLRLLLHGWVVVAALIWVFVKLPQEYWIHVAQLDVTDTLANYAWAWPLLIGLVLVLAAVLWFVVRPRLPEADHGWRFAADPMPEEMDTAAEQWAWQAKWGAIRSWATVEKIVLVGLISVIYGQTLPGMDATNVQLFIGVTVVVVANAFFTLALARRSVSIESATLGFLARMAANVVFVLVADWLLGREGGGIDAVSTLFYLGLISLITTLHDRYRPVLATRVIAERAAATPNPA